MVRTKETQEENDEIMSKPRAWLCWSGGKDSAWALYVEHQRAEVDVVGLLTTMTEDYGRISMHGIREEILLAQADAANLTVHRVNIPAPCPNEVYEDRMGQALREAKAAGVTSVVFGDLFLTDIRAYREKQLDGTGITPRFPLWKQPTRQLASCMIGAGLVAYITCLDPKKMPRTLAGSIYDQQLLDALPDAVDPCAENGEFHTCVVSGPMFRHSLSVEVGETVDRDGFVFTDLLLAAEHGNGR
jgi:uncharacterized protein (TIGR00290 family)